MPFGRFCGSARQSSEPSEFLPHLPGRARRGQSIDEPGLLFGAEESLRWFVPAEVGDRRLPHEDRLRGVATVVDLARIQGFHRLQRVKVGKSEPTPSASASFRLLGSSERCEY